VLFRSLIEGVSGASEVHHRLWLAIEDADGSTTLPPQFYPLSGTDTSELKNTSGNIVTVRFDAGLPLIPKRLEGIDFDFKGTINGTHTAKLEYRLDGGTFKTWFIMNDNGDKAGREFPPGLSAKFFDLRLTFISDDNNTPELHSLRLRTQLQPDPSQVIPISVLLADGLTRLNGVRSTTRSADLTQLRTWNAQPEPIVLKRPDFGVDRTVLMLPGTYQEREVHHERSRRSDYLVSFILLLTGPNVNTALWNEFTWNEAVWG